MSGKGSILGNIIRTSIRTVIRSRVRRLGSSTVAARSLHHSPLRLSSHSCRSRTVRRIHRVLRSHQRFRLYIWGRSSTPAHPSPSSTSHAPHPRQHQDPAYPSDSPTKRCARSTRRSSCPARSCPSAPRVIQPCGAVHRSRRSTLSSRARSSCITSSPGCRTGSGGRIRLSLMG